MKMPKFTNTTTDNAQVMITREKFTAPFIVQPLKERPDFMFSNLDVAARNADGELVVRALITIDGDWYDVKRNTLDLSWANGMAEVVTAAYTVTYDVNKRGETVAVQRIPEKQRV